MALEPRTRAAVSIHIALAAQADIPAAAVDRLSAVELDILVVAMELDIPAGVPVDSAVALLAGLIFAPDGLVANGWVLDDGGAAESSGCDGPEREMAPLPRPALR
jgi:hypothetical protein